MKRLPWFASFTMFIVLCASSAYWAMQLFQPQLRAVAAAPQAEPSAVTLDAAKELFGRSVTAGPISNYQLKGVVAAARRGGSVAILSVDGKPARAVAAGAELTPGVTVREIHPNYVLLSASGVIQRIELAASAKGQAGPALPPGATAPVMSSVRPSTLVPGSSSGDLLQPLPQGTVRNP